MVPPDPPQSSEPPESPDPAYVYLLRCADGSLYCGWSTDLERRMAAHAAGRGSRYTASRRPVALAAAWQTPGRGAARRLEVALKRLDRAGKERLVAGASLPDVRRLEGERNDAARALDVAWPPPAPPASSSS